MPTALAAYLQEKLELLNGCALRFPLEALEEVERFAWRARQRWPLVSFEIRLAGADKALWLTLTGPKGAPEQIASELFAESQAAA